MSSSLNHTLVVIITDSITNSVFESQVLIPLQKRMHAQQCGHAYIISFERKAIPPSLIDRFQNTYGVTFIIEKMLPFFGTITLWPACRTLSKRLRSFQDYSLIARGPLAGYIALKACGAATPLIVQARGLLAEEYDYTIDKTEEQGELSWLIHRIRKYLFFRLERTIYSQASRYTIEAVSNALRDYLIEKYGTPKSSITIAAYDTPQKITAAVRAQWKTEIRNRLEIPLDATVLCYSGSLKAWQNITETIAYAQTEIGNNKNTYFVLYTQEVKQAVELLQYSSIPENNYRVLSVAQGELLNYMAACDKGILFRHKHIINWVSRPTKALEYQAAHLEIVHNNTIAMLADIDRSATRKKRR